MTTPEPTQPDLSTLRGLRDSIREKQAALSARPFDNNGYPLPVEPGSPPAELPPAA
jgi:hypothetical protein